MTALTGLWFVARSTNQSAATNSEPLAPDISLLFRGADLEHASDAAGSIISQNVADTDWNSLHQCFGARFPALPKEPPENQAEPLFLPAQDSNDPAVLKIKKIDDCIHVNVVDSGALEGDERHRIKTLEAELQTLKLASSTAPHPVWQTNETNQVTWCNDAYKNLYENVKHNTQDLSQPLFKNTIESIEVAGQFRTSLPSKDKNATLWFDVTTTHVNGGKVFHATDINAVIRAEVAQRNFVQTLAKTFAQLSTGLAIFDRNAQLALFNPALIDLTALPAEFLSARPDLSSFFDRLRDNRVMPEPKNYVSWRQEISDVISAATDGRYQETWTLESGQTYRVSGRPHPDGAIAFLIEDISAEMLLTRNFRAELELSQSLMDTFDDALVVFSSAGLLQFCNASYRDMWKLDPENSFAEVTIIDTIKEWQLQCEPNQIWENLRDFVMNFEERIHWEAQVMRTDGGVLQCHVDPIVSGATLVRFERIKPKQPVQAVATKITT